MCSRNGIILTVFLLALATPAFALGPSNVANTVHNLSASSTSQYATNESQICIFCHTPHGGSLDGPLWNRGNPTPTGWTNYTSATASNYLQSLPTTRVPDKESLLCLSCHDGSVSVNHVLVGDTSNPTYPNITTSMNGATDTTIQSLAFTGSPGARIGATSTNLTGTGDLSDDHPISFSYDNVLAEFSGGSRAGELKTVAQAETAGVRFFGTNHRVECSSCHDPHVDYINNPQYTPFLVMSNSGSALCLACHTK